MSANLFTTITISDEQLSQLQGKVVVITGGSSGIGLAMVVLFAEKGAKLVVGDLNPMPEDTPHVTFCKTDVTNWKDLQHLFATAKQVHGRIDVVLANAGIKPIANYLKLEKNDSGELIMPSQTCFDVNLFGCINTVALGLHYLQQQDSGGVIILTASGSSYVRFGTVDYTTSKHGVLGFMRALYHRLSTTPYKIRINMIAPAFTATNLVPLDVLQGIGLPLQTSRGVAYSAGLLAVDESRNGQAIYSEHGRFREVEEPMLAFNAQLMELSTKDEQSLQTGLTDLDWKTLFI